MKTKNIYENIELKECWEFGVNDLLIEVVVNGRRYRGSITEYDK